MLEIGPRHTPMYRQELLQPFFGFIKSAESSCWVGAGGMGKTRLLDFLMEPDTQSHYLKDLATKTLLIRMDMNRASEPTEWGFYELGLTTVIQACGRIEECKSLYEQWTQMLLIPLLSSPDPFKALRFLELTTGNLCALDYKICFLLDEFDEEYQKLPLKFFKHLRAIRDANKNRLCYALFLRNMPGGLRSSIDNEDFYELFSRNVIGIGPYTLSDSIEMLKQLEARRSHPLRSDTTRSNLFKVSGGHPGLLQALFGLMMETAEDDSRLMDINWLSSQDSVIEECRKIFNSITLDEKKGVMGFLFGQVVPSQIQKALTTKGLFDTTNQNLKIFSPIFEACLRKLAEQHKE